MIFISILLMAYLLWVVISVKDRQHYGYESTMQIYDYATDSHLKTTGRKKIFDSLVGEYVEFEEVDSSYLKLDSDSKDKQTL